MRNTARARSALPATTYGQVDVREVPLLGYLNFRASPAAEDVLAAAKSALGIPLPLAPNTVAETSGLTAVWLGPDEWLVITLPGQLDDVEQSLHAALSGQHVAITDVSSGYTSIEIVGGGARELLAKGCTIDLHPRSFGIGRSAQTLLAKTGVLIHQLDDTPTFRVVVRRSFATYLWVWLNDAC